MCDKLTLHKKNWQKKPPLSDSTVRSDKQVALGKTHSDAEPARDQELVRAMSHDRFHIWCRKLHVRWPMLAAWDTKLDEDTGDDEAASYDISCCAHCIGVAVRFEQAVDHD